MAHQIETRREHARGCGYRKEGGLYLVCDGPGRDCERMPIPLTSCPTCSQGIKPARGWTWIESEPILDANPCKRSERLAPVFDAKLGPDPTRTIKCVDCPMGVSMGRVGLIWVGSKYYAAPDDFLREASRQGISRRIPAIPQGFKLGEHWVWLAHRETIPTVHEDHCASRNPDVTVECDCEAEPTPGVFQVFKPSRIEYVVKADDDEEKLGRLVKHDVTLVKIEKLGETLPLIN
jgi:hypothetical protein